MSIPAETPWLDTTWPSRTQRASRTTVQSPRSASASSKPQWVATRRLVPTPDATSNSDPVQTLVTHVAEAATACNHARRVSSSRRAGATRFSDLASMPCSTQIRPYRSAGKLRLRRRRCVAARPSQPCWFRRQAAAAPEAVCRCSSLALGGGASPGVPPIWVLVGPDRICDPLHQTCFEAATDEHSLASVA